MRRARLLIGVAATALILAILPGAAGAADPASVSIGDVSVTEPSTRNGTIGIELPVTVHGGAASTVTVGWETVGGSAGLTDYVNASGSLVIPAGAAGGAIAVDIRTDRESEPAETFTVQITSVSGASAADPSGQVTIRPTASGLSVGDVVVGSRMAGCSGSLSRQPSEVRRTRRSRSGGNFAPGPARLGWTRRPPRARGRSRRARWARSSGSRPPATSRSNPMRRSNW